MKNKKGLALSRVEGFTLIELVVVIAIIAILSGVILFSITEYISRGKDSNVSASLAVLIPAGEVWYNGNGNSYKNKTYDFCNPDNNDVYKNMIAQLPANTDFFCLAESQAWSACAIKFTKSNPEKAFCVDSRGVKRDICASECIPTMPTECPPTRPTECPQGD